MRTTISLDDELVEQAIMLTDIEEKPALLRAALEALIERESARRLAKLGGSDKNASVAARRRDGN